MDVQGSGYITSLTSQNVMTSSSHLTTTTGDNKPQRRVTSQQLNSQSACVGGLAFGSSTDRQTQVKNTRIPGGLAEYEDWRAHNKPRLRYL